MIEVVGVHFQKVKKVYYFDPKGLQIKQGQAVIVETQYGLEYGICRLANCQVEDSAVTPPLKAVVRLATEADQATQAAHAQKEKQAYVTGVRKIREHKLDMKLVAVDYTFDGSKIIFFFTADGRVDFRELVRDLASVFHARIELRQIGVRDEAQMLGGLGVCGKPFCCATLLGEFAPVSIKMAKEQNLSLNPTKISGTCGRLMCCLKYEQSAYVDLHKRTPPVDSLVKTPDGEGIVTDVSLLRERVKVMLNNGDNEARQYNCCDVCLLKKKARGPEEKKSGKKSD